MAWFPIDVGTSVGGQHHGKGPTHHGHNEDKDADYVSNTMHQDYDSGYVS